MLNIYSLYELLEKEVELKSPEKFLSLCDEIICRNDASSIPILLSYFRDSRDYTWVFESLMLAMESYPEDLHVRELLLNLRIIMDSSNSWACEIFNRLLNSETSKNLLLDNLELANKKDLSELLNNLSKMYPHHNTWLKEHCLI